MIQFYMMLNSLATLPKSSLAFAKSIGMATSALKSAPDSLQFDNVGRNREGIKLSDKESEAVKQYREVETKYFNADGSEKPGAMLAPNGERTNLTKLQWIQVRTDNFKRFYGDWEKDGIELRGLVGDDETGSHKRGISGSATRPARSTNSGPLVDGNGEPVIFYHGTNVTIRLGYVNKGCKLH